MAHCPLALLTDLRAVLAEMRTWSGVIEKWPGISYLRRAPPLPGPRRRADVKGRAGWVQMSFRAPRSAESCDAAMASA
jgi:hypothetical protein